jgi:hypothetical protein
MAVPTTAMKNVLNAIGRALGIATTLGGRVAKLDTDGTYVGDITGAGATQAIAGKAGSASAGGAVTITGGAGRWPSRQRSKVLLPAPLGPSSPVQGAETSKDTPESASRSP